MNEFSRRGLLSGIAASGILGGLSALGLLRQPPAGAATTVGQPLAELQGIEAWLNGPPTTIRELQGRVIALQFWTFACINCHSP